MNHWTAIITLLMGHFGNDESKVALWLDVENPMLGNQRPIEMIKIGRAQKLLDFIETSIMENKPECLESEVRGT